MKGNNVTICVLGIRGFPCIEGGVEKHCEQLYPRMDEDFIVFRRKPYISETCLKESKYKNIKFIDLPSTKIKGFETVFHSFIATIKAIILKPDIVHIHNIGPAMFSGIFVRRRIPIVLTYHSPNYEHEKWGRLAKILLRYSERVALKNSSRIIFVNKFQLEKYSSDIQKKSVYISNGVEKAYLTTGTDFLNKKGIEVGKYILSVGRIVPEKGFDTLIKSFLVSEHKGYKLVIAGGIGHENKYQELLNKLANNEVIFTGYVIGEQLAQLYSNAAIYVMASNNEGFPIALLEAMSYGLDVIVSNIKAHKLIKLNDDDYFTPGDDHDLARRISDRLIAPKKRKYNLADYNWNTVAMKTHKTFREAKMDESLTCK